MINIILKFRYVFIIAIIFLLFSSLIFLMVGIVQSITGFLEFYRLGFTVSETEKPGVFMLESLDFFMIALGFMIVGLGFGRLFLFDKISSDRLPKWLRIDSLKELKFLLWETILLTMVIFLITHLARSDMKSFDILIFPGVILILSLSLFLIKWQKSKDK